ncbi:hypothetical protein ACIBAC_00110 [Streptomyces sp. NPDC051362]|uniref:hypothetical protein n=1 Tax=Streptomyces sp. NPDC051362 TaxID=3365651 RepID=UPI0037B2A5BB
MTARYTAAQFRALMEQRRGGRAVQPAAAAKAPAKKKSPKKAPPHPGLPSTPPTPAVEPLLASLSGTGRTWTLLMPYREEMLDSNQRLHHMAVHRIRKRLREDAANLAVGLPRLQRAAVYYFLHPRPLSRKRDPGNWAPTVKPYVDGLVTDGGLLPDDSHEFLMGPIPVMGEPVTTGFARMSLVIVELTGPLTS